MTIIAATLTPAQQDLPYILPKCCFPRRFGFLVTLHNQLDVHIGIFSFLVFSHQLSKEGLNK